MCAFVVRLSLACCFFAKGEKDRNVTYKAGFDSYTLDEDVAMETMMMKKRKESEEKRERKLKISLKNSALFTAP